MNRNRDTHKPVPTIDPLMRYSRRSFLKASTAAAVYAGLPAWAQGDTKPIPRTVTDVALCKRYDYPLIRQTMSGMFDRLGDVRTLVKGKHVTAKVNLVNTSKESLGGIPLQYTVTTHPYVAMACGSLLVEYGAKRVKFVDQLPFKELGQESFEGYGFDLNEFKQAMDGKVRFENTRNGGWSGKYDLVKVPNGGLLASAWEVNKAYTETDVLVSIGKMKNHVSGGVTIGMKNLFGIPPSSRYGDDLKDEPDEHAIGYRSNTMHNCTHKPMTSVSTFNNDSREGEHGYNVPRYIVDLNAAFPIDLVVVDAISTIQSGEGWWIGSAISPITPGLLLAGRNAVCTDSVGAAVMGFNPDAGDLETPFNNGTNYLKLARQLGLGENRLAELDVSGLSLEKARFQYEPTYQRPRA